MNFWIELSKLVREYRRGLRQDRKRQAQKAREHKEQTGTDLGAGPVAAPQVPARSLEAEAEQLEAQLGSHVKELEKTVGIFEEINRGMKDLDKPSPARAPTPPEPIPRSIPYAPPVASETREPVPRSPRPFIAKIK